MVNYMAMYLLSVASMVRRPVNDELRRILEGISCDVKEAVLWCSPEANQRNQRKTPGSLVTVEIRTISQPNTSPNVYGKNKFLDCLV